MERVGPDFTITFQHARLASDLELSVQVSPDLGFASWRDAILSPAVDADGMLELVDDTRPTVRIHRFTAGRDAARMFFRIRAAAVSP